MVGAAQQELLERGVGGGVVDEGSVFDVVVDAHTAVAAPVGAVVGVVRVDFGAEAHDDLAGVFPGG